MKISTNESPLSRGCLRTKLSPPGSLENLIHLKMPRIRFFPLLKIDTKGIVPVKGDRNRVDHRTNSYFKPVAILVEVQS
jgi:hypothetical protein